MKTFMFVMTAALSLLAHAEDDRVVDTGSMSSSTTAGGTTALGHGVACCGQEALDRTLTHPNYTNVGPGMTGKGQGTAGSGSEAPGSEKRGTR